MHARSTGMERSGPNDADQNMARSSMRFLAAVDVEAWDSVASVTLLALIEEEFGIELDVQALGQLNSYRTIFEYLEVRTEQIT